MVSIIANIDCVACAKRLYNDSKSSRIVDSTPYNAISPYSPIRYRLDMGEEKTCGGRAKMGYGQNRSNTGVVEEK